MESAVWRRVTIIPFEKTSSKKRKIIHEIIEQKCSKSISKILKMDSNTKKWLVEWNDFSRSWELYESIKDTYTFQKYVENLVPKDLSEATYIS
jgi:hypothetical protein